MIYAVSIDFWFGIQDLEITNLEIRPLKRFEGAAPRCPLLLNPYPFPPLPTRATSPLPAPGNQPGTLEISLLFTGNHARTLYRC